MSHSLQQSVPKQVETLHLEHNNILQAINRPPLVGSSPLPQFVPKVHIFIDKLRIKVINLLSQICPSNIGPGTNCFDSETFGCYCLVGVDVSHISLIKFFQ